MERLRKPKQRSRGKRPARAARQLEESALMTVLTQELYNVMSDAVIEIGVSRAQQRLGLELALRGKRRVRPSLGVLKTLHGVSLLVAMWRRDARYRELDGAPKVLPYYGKGATLEALVKQCIPGTPIPEAVKILCAQSEVRMLKGEKVALVGNPVNIMQKTPATSLAWMINQLRHLAETCVYNARIPSHKKGMGRFERQVYGALPKKRYAVWERSIRKLLQATSNTIEGDLAAEDPQMLSGKDKICGVGLYVFREDGKLG
jgi:hypothetical protein